MTWPHEARSDELRRPYDVQETVPMFEAVPEPIDPQQIEMFDPQELGKKRKKRKGSNR